MSKLPLYAIIFCLIASGLGLAAYRHVTMQIPLLPGATSPVWLVEARIDFMAQEEPVLVRFNIPNNPPGFTVFTEQSASPGYGFSLIQRAKSRYGEWSIREASGHQTLYYKVHVIQAPPRTTSESAGRPAPAAIYWDEAESTAAEQILSQVHAITSTPESMTRELIKLVNATDLPQNLSLLLASNGKVQVIEKLLNQAEIPARVSLGLQLKDARRRQPLSPLIEVYSNNQWLLFNPYTGEQGIPESFLLWQQGGISLLDVEGGTGSQVTFSMLRQTVPAMELAIAQTDNKGLALFGIHRLPIEEQSIFKMLLLLPMGVFIVVLMRILVGFRTSGTFMPVLIAFSFLQVSLSLGLISFTVIVSIGLIVRGYLSRLNLLLVARIASIVIIIIFIVFILSLLGYHLGFNTGTTITVFPMVIMAWTIERMSILWEEEGPREVFVQGVGSLVVAVIAYVFMSNNTIVHLSFNFPELNLILLALIFFFGQYTGYRLSEFLRFRVMLQDAN